MHGASAQRCEVGAGSGLAEQLAPEDVTEQRLHDEPFGLLSRAVLDDRRDSPGTDHEVGAGDSRAGELLVDDELLDRSGVESVGLGPVRCQVAGLGKSSALLVLGQRGDRVHAIAGDVTELGVSTFEVDLERAALAGDGAAGQTGRRLLGAAGQRGDRQVERDGAAEIEVSVVLEREADPAEHLDAVAGDRTRAVKRHGCGDVGGEVGLARRHASADRGAGIPRHGVDRLGGLEHLRAEVLDGLERADRLAELLAHLGVVDRGVEAPLRDAGGFGRGESDEHAAYGIVVDAFSAVT